MTLKPHMSDPGQSSVICPSGGLLTGVSSLNFGFFRKIFLFPLTPNQF